ncbi:non-ribosomal peptide synthetase/type I polyketide synthase [Pollutimonas subterranea]|nr:non-ribosomal peptide synthetase/type I polyketide synthase [Pollutimonas subterranea]
MQKPSSSTFLERLAHDKAGLPSTVRLPLNAEQTRLWFIDKLSQNSQGFVLQASFLLRGAVDPTVWQKAVRLTVERHAILSARLVEHDNKAWLELADTSSELEMCEADTPRALPPGTLFRAMLQPRAEHYQLTFLIHHLIADRSSMAILINDCFTSVRGIGLPSAAQFTERLLARQAEPANAPEALEWWRAALEGAPAELALPFDHPRPPERGRRGATISLPLTEDADLTALSKSLGATPFMTYLALYVQLLQRWSGEEDLVIGCPVSIRKTREDQQMVGFLVNTLPLRLKPGLNDDLATRVSQVKQTLLNTLGQPAVTLDQIVSTLNPRRHLNRNALFQAMFVLQAQPLAMPTLPDIDIEALSTAPLAPEVDLNLSVERTTDPQTPYVAHLEYDPELFHAETALEFLQQFIALCRAAAQPQGAAQKPSASHQLACWKGPRLALPPHTVDTLILETLNGLAPERPMLQDAGQTLSCKELLWNIAHTSDALEAAGVAPYTRVSLCLPRLTELVPALLAVWRLGACAVFLPTDGPHDVIAERATLAGANIVLIGTDSPDLAGLAADSCKVLTWDALRHAHSSGVHARTDMGAFKEEPAYACFTSGTTGTPKAVFISHASLLNHALDCSRRFELDATDRVLQFAAPAFDVLLEEVIPALLSGSSLVQLATGYTGDLEAFHQALEDKRITVANLPAAFWHTWVHELIAAGTPVPTTLRLLITGSEAVQAAAARIWRTHAAHCRLLCAYGLTETTISAGFMQVDDVPGHWSTMPLAEAVQNTELAVVGPDNQPLPALCLGEIRVRGQALMLSSTGEVHPISGRAPITELHTGDYGRMDLNGRLWCLGRRDRQIKIRGIRVEPATLEHALTRISGISEAAALAIPVGQRHSLWAFVTGHAAPAAAAIKAALQNRLPDVLMPEQIIALPSLPRTAQGKTDYKALAARAAQQPRPPSDTRLNSGRERLIAQLFSEVLQRSPVGPEDNFFDLGGDSISSLQVISRARRAGVDLSAKTVFEYQTVRAIAQQTTETAKASHDAQSCGSVWATPILSWFKSEMKGAWRQFNQAVVIALPDPVDLPRLQQALSAVVHCHEIFGLHVATAPDGEVSYHIPTTRPAPLFSVVTRPDDVADSAWATLRQRHLAEAQGRLDPSTGINVSAVALPADKQLMLTVHHLCIDVLSWQVVLRDLQNAYEAADRLDASPLRRHGSPWRRWALALQDFSLDPDVRASLPFWIKSLSARPTPLAPGLPAKPGIEADARVHQLALSTELTQHLLRKVPAVWGLRMDETLLTALALAHAADESVVLRVDLERNGRASPLDDLDISETVGWFTSVIPLSLQTGRNAQTMAQAVKARLADVPHEGLSYGLLRYGNNPETVRLLAGLPEADALLNYVGILDGWAQGPFQPVDADTGPTIAPDLARSHRIELNAGVVAGQLRVALNYADGHGSKQAAASLMANIERALNRIAAETGYQRSVGGQADVANNEVRAAGALPHIPVTPLQRGILLHSLHEPQTYFDQLHFRLDGPLNLDALKTAWALLLDRHGALRCAFGFDDNDEPCQYIESGLALSWQLYDWTTLDEPESRRELQTLMQADRQKGFVLDQAPLMRMHLIKQAQDRHDWIWSSHHLILDGWSVSILMQDCLSAYTASLEGTVPDWPSPPDWHAFVHRWHRLNAAGALLWWKQALANVAPTLMAQRDTVGLAPPAQRALHDAGIALDPAIRDALASVCRRHGVPLGVLIQASWAMLLRRYRSIDTVVFGITLAHRPPEFNNADALVGMTINTVPVIADIQPDMPLSTLLANLRQQSFERTDHAFVGLEEILQTARHDPACPLFDTLLLVQNYPRPTTLAASDLTIQVCDVREQTNFALTAIVTTGEDAAMSLAWDSTRISDALGRDVLNHWHQLLRAMTHDAPSLVRDLSIYTDIALNKRIALATGPDSELSAPDVLERFDQWVDATPEHPAVQALEGCFSYRALSCAADQLCQALRDSGVVTGEPVAILLPRGARAIAALLGVMKSGAMAVPIDAAYPAERIAFMLQDSQARWLLTESALTDRLPSPLPIRALFIDQMPDTTQPVVTHRPEISPTSPAYLIYTSGSTGQPKGAITHHGGLANMMRIQQYHLCPKATDRVLQFAALSFDASIWEIFMALGSGATLHVPDPVAVRFGEELLDTIEHERITIATLPPSLMATLPPRALPSLRILMVAGEACPDVVVEKWADGRRLFNCYGPSETSVCSSLHEVTGRTLHIPIGKPAAHTRAYVIDPDGQLVPPGGEGELLIGGDGVGLGYLHRAELTAERFKPDSWSTEPGNRVYHSGDRVHVGHNGELTFYGRIDRQLKVRGFRVEPGEIERQLEQLGPIDKALVGLSPRVDAEPVLLAWVLPRAGLTIDTQRLRDDLSRRLPSHLVPAVIQALQQIPLTPNGKIDWAALPMPADGAYAIEAPVQTDSTDRARTIAQKLESIWAELLKLPRVDWHGNFFDLGGQSLLLVKMQPMLRNTFNIKVPTRILFEHVTIYALAQWLATQQTAEPGVPEVDSDSIAIVGMACRLPGADSAEAFWTLLREGREGITEFESDLSGDTLQAGQSHFVPRCGVIPDSDQFDAAFFGIGARDALLLDPQHRLFLEGAWNAFEDAAEIPGGNIGVFAGCSHNTWLREVLVPGGETLGGPAGFHAITANDKDFLATQVAYRLNLSGPAVTVQSACSTSLVAVAQAVDALRAGRCDMALAGGVSLSFPDPSGYVYEPGMILSPDGHCRSFSADAAGTVPAAGMGVVLLKPLEKALEDGNRIYATIRGVGVSNDGARKMSFAAPGIEGQAKAIQQALSDAGLRSDEVDLVEAHGTGTALGDPVEITALGKAYAKGRSRPLLIGSVKSNIGHADAAAGIAGLIKATLSLHHQFLPASLHADRLNPKLDPGPQPWFEIARVGSTLSPPGRPLRAGVSSFGIGGTNAHVLLEQAPCRQAIQTVNDNWQVVPVSASVPGQLAVVLKKLEDHLRHSPTPLALADIATTLQQGRTAMKARIALIADKTSGLIQLLPGTVTDTVTLGSGTTRRPPKIALLLPGQGVQHPGMGAALSAQYPAFREHLAALSDLLRPLLNLSLIDTLNDSALDSGFWQDTRVAQPAILAISLACAQWWASLGIKADLMLGHSLGEYTAACLAGVFSPEDALSIVAERARLMAAMPHGAMLAITQEGPAMEALLLRHPALDLAAINGPRQAIISGPVDAIDTLAAELAQQLLPAQRLCTSHAFHSRSMQPAADALRAFLSTRVLNPPTGKFVSNLTGTWITPEQAVSPDYWAEHMLAPVRFAQGLQTLQDKGAGLAIEAGPGRVLTMLARSKGLPACPSLDAASRSGTSSAPEHAPAHIQSVAQLWESGIEVDWSAFNTQPGKRIALPGYSWARQVFRPKAVSIPAAPDTEATPPKEKPSPDHWFYTPLWVRRSPVTCADASGPLLIYSSAMALANPVAQVLRQSGREVRVATSAEALLAVPGEARTQLVVLMPPAGGQSALAIMTQLRTTLLTVRDAILACHPKPMRIDLVTMSGAAVQGSEPLCPANTALIAGFRVLAHEFPEHLFAGLDLVSPDPVLVARQMQEWLNTERTGQFLAYRQGQYWNEEVARCHMPPAQPWPLRAGGTVLITGAAGGVGQAFALDLARHADTPHLLLATHRTPLPDMLCRQLQALGAKISQLTLELADEQSTTDTLTNWQNAFGPINGVIHAAGLADYGGVMARRSAGSIDSVLAPKIIGLHGIESALTGLPLDFMVLCSTLGSFLPAAKFGQVAYSAANAYLDTAAAALVQRHPWRAVTINWDDWVEVGMTVAARQRAGLQALSAESGLLHDEGPAAVRRVLPTPLTRVAIAVNDLTALVARSGTWFSDELAGPNIDSTDRPVSSVTAPVAQALAGPADLCPVLEDLFCEVLNEPVCGPHGNFFDLGGHSLLAMQLISRVKETTGLDATLIDLFASPTPDALAQLLVTKAPETP